MLEENEARAFVELGLTSRQARVFLNLLKYKSQTAKTLAVTSKLARQDIYKVLDELMELGLVDRQISSPTKFTAISIDDALTILLNHKVQQTTNLESKTRLLIKNLKNQNPKTAKDEEPNLFLISKGETFVFKARKAVKAAQKSIDIVSSSRNLSQGLFYLLEELERAIKRGVKIRCITDTLEDKGSHSQKLWALSNSPFFEVRTMQNHSKQRFCIYDKKELSIVISSETDFVKSAVLWSNCTSIVDTYFDHYEMMWPTATLYTQNKTNGIVQLQ
jgi:sugar-specific transcriptional regulator TrmB